MNLSLRMYTMWEGLWTSCGFYDLKNRTVRFVLEHSRFARNLLCCSGLDDPRSRSMRMRTSLSFPKFHACAVTCFSAVLMMARLGVLVLFPLLFHSVFSISFHLPVRTRKCLKEEIHKDVLVTGEYEISEQPNTKVNLKVVLMLMLTLLMLMLITRRRQLKQLLHYFIYIVLFIIID